MGEGSVLEVAGVLTEMSSDSSFTGTTALLLLHK